MLDAFVVPEITVEANGEGEPIELGEGAGKAFLLTLAVTRIVEQEALDVSIWGSADGKEWGAKPLTAFPQKFYQGVYQLWMELREKPEVKFLKAKWVVNRWGVGQTKPRFSFLVKIQEQALAGAAR
ncbi:MAG: hypothetical protein A3J28_12055 [Acidobacteria bacterium RIFCSPLOWO2_12_FULL_60_22]|nr:MAG: hypothetical protein A3J28_12055 [Acidobacteria bacterium RIFCSPLOWO2_12_FULL_60_22]